MIPRRPLGTRRPACSLALASLALAIPLVFLSGCGSDEDELEGTGRVVEGDQCFLSEVTYFGDDAGLMRRASPLCEPSEIDPWACTDNLGDLDAVTDTMLDFCANAVVFGEISFEGNDPTSETVQLIILALDDEGHEILISANDIDLTQIGETPDGVLATPYMVGPCEITAGVNLDTDCAEYACDWTETSTLPCGGIFASSSTEVPVTCYEDEQPDPCDPGALTFGASDSVTITELAVVTLEDRLSVLENSIAAGTFDVTVRAEFEDGTYSDLQLSGQFRNRVASRPFTSVSDLTCTPCF